jgi:hypothetical protein
MVFKAVNDKGDDEVKHMITIVEIPQIPSIS